MAELLFRFDNTPFGGAHDITLNATQMPDWSPTNEEAHINSHRMDTGRMWQYAWYRKKEYQFRFTDVGTDLAATMGSIAGGGVNFLWYENVNTENSGTGTFVYAGEFEQLPVAPDLTDFRFTIRETG